jgi:hypothetical protein
MKDQLKLFMYLNSDHVFEEASTPKYSFWIVHSKYFWIKFTAASKVELIQNIWGATTLLRT